MSGSPSTARRAVSALLAAVLAATVLSGDTVLGQNGNSLAGEVNPELVIPMANVAVVGDGLLAAPAIGPVRPDDASPRRTARSNAPPSITRHGDRRRPTTHASMPPS